MDYLGKKMEKEQKFRAQKSELTILDLFWSFQSGSQNIRSNSIPWSYENLGSNSDPNLKNWDLDPDLFRSRSQRAIHWMLRKKNLVFPRPTLYIQKCLGDIPIIFVPNKKEMVRSISNILLKKTKQGR